MKNLFLLVHVFIFPLLCPAQWSTDPYQNTPVGVTSGEQVIPLVASHSSGISYIAWFSQENGNYNVRLQKFDIFGNKLWDNQGLLVSNNPSMTWLTDWDIAVDLDTCAILVFQDIRTGINNIYAYRISPSGEFLWGANGLALSNNSDFEATPIVAVTPENNCIFAWSRSSTPQSIMLQKVSPAGNILWDLNGVQYTGTQDYTWPVLVPVFNDEVLLAFFKQTGPFWAPTKNIFVQRFNITGQPVWENGIAISNNAGIPAYVKAQMIADGDNGGFVTWHRDNGSYFDAYVQHVKNNGSLTFPANGVAVSLDASSHQIDPVIAFEPTLNSLFVAWRQHDFNQNNRGISAQKISSTGARVWGDYGKTIIPMQSGEKWSLSLSLTDHEPVIVYLDQPSGSAANLVKAIRLNNDGNTVWLGGQRNISLASSNKLHMTTTDFMNGQMIATWEDQRNDGGDIFAQNLKPDGTLGPLTPSLTVYPPKLTFENEMHFIEGLDFVVKNTFPVPLPISNMTVSGEIGQFSYMWYVFPDLTNSFPIDIQPADSMVFTVAFDIPLKGRSYLYDTVRIWSNAQEYHVLIEMDPAAFPSGIFDNDGNSTVEVYPNPFSHHTTFFISMQESDSFSLDIINSLGQPIKTIVSQTSGESKVFYWDGKNENGLAVSPGIYFLKIKTGDQFHVKKLIKTR